MYCVLRKTARGLIGGLLTPGSKPELKTRDSAVGGCLDKKRRRPALRARAEEDRRTCSRLGNGENWVVRGAHQRKAQGLLVQKMISLE